MICRLRLLPCLAGWALPTPRERLLLPRRRVRAVASSSGGLGRRAVSSLPCLSPSPSPSPWSRAVYPSAGGRLCRYLSYTPQNTEQVMIRSTYIAHCEQFGDNVAAGFIAGRACRCCEKQPCAHCVHHCVCLPRRLFFSTQECRRQDRRLPGNVYLASGGVLERVHPGHLSIYVRSTEYIRSPPYGGGSNTSPADSASCQWRLASHRGGWRSSRKPVRSTEYSGSIVTDSGLREALRE